MLFFKKHPILIYTTLTITFFTITISTLIYFILTINNYNVNSNPQIIDEQKSHKFLIKEVGGKINIFEDDNSSPSIILNKPTIFLPEYDRKMLSNGIYIDNIDELHSLMEDYDD